MHRKYIGTKIIAAYPVTPDDPRGDGYAVTYADGYQSFSPRAVFEEAYRAIEGEGQALTFGDALHMLKLGKKVARAGWNGKGMWLELVPAEHWFLGIEERRQLQDRLPWIGMNTADRKFVPWLCSQTDALAEDWQVVE